MTSADHRDEPSAIAAALLALGDRWTLLILQRAFLTHTRRFSGWRDALGVSESVLTQRLAEMVRAGLLAPGPYRTDGRTRTQYLLTAKAVELWPFLVAIWAWERRWVEPPHGAARLRHDACGADTTVRLGCGACGGVPVTARDTAATTGRRETLGNVAVPRHHRRTVRVDVADPLSYYPHTMEILGDRWSTVLLAAALLRVRRFADFEQQLGIAPSVLSDRLGRFVELGVLARVPDPRGREEYRLTDKGLDFFPVYAFLLDWAARWYTDPPGRGLVVEHRECGAVLRPRLHCTACGVAVERDTVHFDH